MRARRAGTEGRDLRPEEILEWARPYGGARGQVVTRWDGGTWHCPACDVALTPRDAAVLLDAVQARTAAGEWARVARRTATEAAGRLAALVAKRDRAGAAAITAQAPAPRQ